MGGGNFPALPRPFFICPEVVAEATALTGRSEALLEMIHTGEIELDFDLQQQCPDVLKLIQKYPRMDLADACIVRMRELFHGCQVVTVDRKDFSLYRRHGRQAIPTVLPLQRDPPCRTWPW